jgi:simple sugar transport system permease protein
MVTTVVFVVGFILCSVQFPNFASTRVVANLLTDNAFLGIVAVGMTFVIISGGIDLSVGSVIGFTTVFLAITIEHYAVPPLAAFAIILVICLLFGAAMGAVIHYFEMPAFIVTLAGMFLARGAAFLMSTESIPIKAPLYTDIGAYTIYLPGGGRLPLIAMIMLAVFAIGIVLLHFTRFGTNVYALGGSRASTALMGVCVAPTIIRVYILSSVLAGLSGIVFSFYTAAGYALSAVGVELDTIAAVVIGGTLLTGGSGFMFGTLMGLMIQGLIQTYITFDGNLSSWWTKIVTGLLLFAFITFQQTMVRLAKRPAALAEGAMS